MPYSETLEHVSQSFTSLPFKTRNRQTYVSAVWRSRFHGTHDFAPPPCDGFALSNLFHYKNFSPKGNLKNRICMFKPSRRAGRWTAVERNCQTYLKAFQPKICVILPPLSMEGNFWEIVLVTLNECPMQQNRAFLLGGSSLRRRTLLTGRKYTESSKHPLI
jgi:hypothetical protein